ncbi:MAG: tyrosine-type recombinase/integrase [Lachnospiraceae bacterium]|nr:tyrosine-type recombinase/integrase [Lachnospiraceae bacterium]MDY5497449.1 tyrosine-type recombinase/integrase [Anaerobutyricum sp.]
MQDLSYNDQINRKNEMRLRQLCNDLPDFCREFFRGIEPTTSSRTRIAYGYDLKIFFHFLEENYPDLEDGPIRQWPVTVLDKITLTQLEEYLDYLKLYEDKDNKIHTNDEKGRMRKIASIRSFYKFFYRKQKIKNNTASLLDMPKNHEQVIVRLEVDEIAKLLDSVEEGDTLTKSQKKYHKKTKIRDLAILTLLLGTGIRVSECVGLDITDLDFETNGMKIHRKGGTEVILYFGEEVRETLLDYLEERRQIIAKEGSENALFLSMQKRRISVRAVENLVKKYCAPVTPLKTITPHKLRSTYGTQLYQETGDIYLVADVLGHKDVNTTRKHYAAIEDQRRRMAAGKVRLREKTDNSEK